MSDDKPSDDIHKALAVVRDKQRQELNRILVLANNGDGDAIRKVLHAHWLTTKLMRRFNVCRTGTNDKPEVTDDEE